MPLHDWRDDRGGDSLHLAWQNQLLDWIQPRLPAEYRVFVGSVPNLSIGAQNGRPDVGVRNWQPSASPTPSAMSSVAPDFEVPATLTLDPDVAVHVDWHGQLIAAIEIVSPRNKDRPDARERYSRRYYGYLRQGVHLMLIDVLPRPVGFSFADAIATDIGLALPETPVPFVLSIRVGEPVPDGTLVAGWRRPLSLGAVLPTIPLALSVHQEVLIDLEHTYREAARRVYLA
jgi:Protein of unknown function (DUF4058)